MKHTLPRLLALMLLICAPRVFALDIDTVNYDRSSLTRYINASADRSKYSSGILPMMISENPEYAAKLLASDHDYFIVVDKGRMRLVLFDRYGRPQLTYRIACARNYGTKHNKPDNRTPEGFFSVEGVYDSKDWLFTDDNGVTSQKKGQYGPKFIRLDTPVSQHIGIHGTSAPWSVGSRTTHGCIRLTNEHILNLVKYVEKGMPVIVTPGMKDRAVNRREGFYVPVVSTVRK